MPEQFNKSSGPLVVDDTCQVPGVVLVGKNEAQAPPIHGVQCGIETREMKFYDHRTGIEFCAAIQGDTYS
jgi:hypothetical protein